MAKLPIKVLLDAKRNPFIPFITTNAVLIDGAEGTLYDLLMNIYNKQEVDKIIADLGTLQRLCGKLNSVEELPTDASAGDTYIVITGTGNSTEYMYIGDKWEELGPFIDLSGYDTKEEVNKKLEDLDRDIKNEISKADEATLKAAKEYTQDELNAYVSHARFWTGLESNYLANKDTINADYDIVLTTDTMQVYIKGMHMAVKNDLSDYYTKEEVKALFGDFESILATLTTLPSITEISESLEEVIDVEEGV